MQLIRQSPAAIDHEVYDEILKCQRANITLKYRHKTSNSEKKVYYFLKKVYSFFHVFMIPYIAVKLIGLLQKNKKQQSASKRWIRWYNFILLQCFQGEGTRKRFSRNRRHYTGISIKRIEKWLNSSKDHFKTNLIFSNKPPLTPLIIKTLPRMQLDRSCWYDVNGSLDQLYSIQLHTICTRCIFSLSEAPTVIAVLKHLKMIFR